MNEVSRRQKQGDEDISAWGVGGGALSVHWGEGLSDFDIFRIRHHNKSRFPVLHDEQTFDV